VTPGSSWELSVRADPGDPTGLQTIDDPMTLDVIGPPAVLIPALTALRGGRVGVEAALPAALVGAILRATGLMVVDGLVLRAVTAQVKTVPAEAPDLLFAFDYTVRYSIEADLGAIGLPGGPKLETTRPIEVTFRNLGVNLEDGRLTFTYDPAQGFRLDVNDPGVFQLGDGIGRLLSVRRVRAGAGSPLWFEVELALALETGVFSIDALRLRIGIDTDKLLTPDGGGSGQATLPAHPISLSDFDVSLNKLAVGLDVPGVVEGHGMLGFSQDGSSSTVEGAIDVDLVPLKMRIDGSLVIYSDGDERALFAALGVRFAPGIPLGTTGAAIFGFSGLLGANMTRRTNSGQSALDWYKSPPLGAVDPLKWKPRPGNWAFGVGTVLGTAYDDGFTFNTKGALILEVPGPRILLATESKFVSPAPAVTDTTSGGILSTVLLDFEAQLLQINLELGISKPNLLELQVPVDVFFNLADPQDWHIRLGQWSPQSQRVAIQILGLFRAWGYLQLEGNGLHNGVLDLDGVSFGHGARAEILWGSRSARIYLEAFLEYHIGVQIDPLFLQGDLAIGGELVLGPVTIGAEGRLSFKAPDPFVVHGEVCGHVSLWLFELSGCVGLTIGDGEAALPAPETPFSAVTPIDRMTGTAADPTATPLDALLHVTFDQDIIDRRPQPALSLISGPLRNQVSNDLYYDWYLEDLQLHGGGGSSPALDPSAWAPYSLPDATPQQVRSQRTLRLLAWAPQSHERVLDYRGGHGTTLREAVSALCGRPPRRPQARCISFDGEPLGPRTRWTLAAGELAPVEVIATDGIAPVVPGQGGAARVVDLVPVDYDGRLPRSRCLRLPAGERRHRNLDELLAEGADTGTATVVPQILAGPGAELPPLRWGPGVVVLGVPSLVSAEAVFVVPAKQRQSGEVAFLDESMRPLGAAVSLASAPEAPDSQGSGPFSNHVARVVRFKASVSRPLAWIVVLPPPSSGEVREQSFLMQVCGIREGDWKAWTDAQEDTQRAIATLQELTGTVGGLPAATAHELLEPDTAYTLSGQLRWARFRDATTTADHGSDAAPEFTTTFRTAKYPPKDIRRYVLRHDPGSSEQPHYFRERMSIAFSSDVVDRLFAKFGRQLVARAKADTGGHVLNQPLSVGAVTEFYPLDGFEQTLYDALSELRDECLPGEWERLFPKLLYTFPEDLRPNTGYTVTLVPRSFGEPVASPAWEKQIQEQVDNGGYVFRFDARTSRWGSFGEHVTAYREAPVGDLFAADAGSLDTALGATSESRGDRAVDRLCAALFGGPLEPAANPRVLRIWVEAAAAAGPFDLPTYVCRAILFDGPEPLLRRRADGSESVEPTLEAVGNGPPAATMPGTRLISSERGTRVIAAFRPADPPPSVRLALHYSPATGAPVEEALVVPVGAVPGSFAEEAP
jgi:hypothetical protein